MNVQYIIIYQEGCDCRDFILYLCPVGELQAQLSLFWQKSKVMRRSDFVIKNDSYVDKDNDNDRDDNRRWKPWRPILKQKRMAIMMQKMAVMMTMRTVTILTTMTMFRRISRMVSNDHALTCPLFRRKLGGTAPTTLFPISPSLPLSRCALDLIQLINKVWRFFLLHI